MFVDAGLSHWVLGRMVQAAAREKPSLLHGTYFFPGSRLYCGIVIFGSVLFPTLGFLGWLFREPFWETLAMAALFSLTIIGYPPVISTSDLGVDQSRWWGAQKRIAWSDIIAIERDAQRHLFRIIGRDGTKIDHGGLNVGQPVLVAMVQQRTQLLIVQKSLLLKVPRKADRQPA